MKANSAKLSNVVFLGKTVKDNADFPAVAQVEGYWDALSCGHLVPARTDINPRALETALENAFILECIATGVARFRLAGCHMNDLMGLEVRGMPLTTFFLPQARRQIGQLIEKTCTSPAITEICLAAPAKFGRSALKAKMLLAPLTDDYGQINRILGCLQSIGNIGRQPRRFEIKDVKVRDMSLRGTESRFSKARQQLAFAEPGAEFTPAPNAEKPGDHHPALQLVVSNG